MTHSTREGIEILKEADLLLQEGKYIEAMDLFLTAYKEQQEYFSHQLQKARQDWLREEIGRLKTELIDEQLINKEGWHRRNSQWIIGMNEAFQTIIDRYHSELNKNNN